MKKILITFILSFVGFISFCSAEIIAISGNGNRYPPSSIRINANSTVNVSPVWNGEILPYSNVCFSLSTYVNCTYNDITYGGTNQTVCFFNKSNDTINFSMPCTNSDNYYTNIYTFTTTALNSSLFECEECQECPLIDSQYCVENSLCPSSDCPIYTGDSNWSSLYINDIQHEGAGTINITIPEEFNWDYTNENDVFDLDIEGYNVDTEYIDGIIRTQNYKPTSEDFTRLVGMLAPYSKYLIFLLFIFIIWAWIKKPFKSKKL